jgi:hypothetical protein
MPKFTNTLSKFEAAFHESRKITIPISAGDYDTTSIMVPVFGDVCPIKFLNAQAMFTNVLLLLGGPDKEKWLSAREEILGTAAPTEVHLCVNSFLNVEQHPRSQRIIDECHETG